jgi:hypothetical protein
MVQMRGESGGQPEGPLAQNTILASDFGAKRLLEKRYVDAIPPNERIRPLSYIFWLFRELLHPSLHGCTPTNDGGASVRRDRSLPSSFNGPCPACCKLWRGKQQPSFGRGYSSASNGKLCATSGLGGGGEDVHVGSLQSGRGPAACFLPWSLLKDEKETNKGLFKSTPRPHVCGLETDA